MIEINKSLRTLNTFGFDQCAERFASANSDSELTELVAEANKKRWPLFILGGGSNIVLTKDIQGLVIHMTNDQIDVVRTDSEGNIRVRAGAGVSWHDFVLHTLTIGANGLENLSLIPGSVGAAPVQNIGAYGVEVKDRIHSVRALHLPTCQWRRFTNSECQFSYRHSFFKTCPNEYAIVEVEFNLGNQCPLTTNYATLKNTLDNQVSSALNAKMISDTVTEIRRARLPDPNLVGNAGSFFHNPVIPDQQLLKLQTQYPDIVNYQDRDGFKKISAAWMIDQAGFKGLRRGHVGVYEKQALVLVHLGDGQGSEILSLASDIQDAIRQQFAIELSIEPLVI